MQFALPPRGGQLPPYGRTSSRISLQRRRQLKVAAIIGLAVLSLLFILSHFRSSSNTSIAAPTGTSGVVIVTVLDRAALSDKYIQRVKKNREDYAKRHGKQCDLFLLALWLLN